MCSSAAAGTRTLSDPSLLPEAEGCVPATAPSTIPVRKRRQTYRLTFRITNSSDEQGDKLRPKDEAVEGQRAEAFLHGPVFTWGLVGV